MTYRKHISHANAGACVHAPSIIEMLSIAGVTESAAARMEYLKDAREGAQEILTRIDAAIAAEGETSKPQTGE